MIDPTRPRVISGYPTLSREVSDIAFENNYLYVSDGPSGLLILDVSRPGNPVLIGSYTNVIYARTAVVSGDRAYLVDSANNGVQALDITSRSNPQKLWHYRSGYSQTAAALDGNILTVLDSKPSFTFIDVTGPSVINGRSTPTIEPGLRVRVQSNVLYAAQGSSGFRMYDYTKLLDLPLIGKDDAGGNATDFALRGNFAFVTSENQAFTSLNIANMTNPIYSSSYPASLAYGVAFLGQRALVADANLGMVVLDVSDAGKLSFVTNYNPAVSPPALAFSSVAMTESYSAAVETNWFHLLPAKGPYYRLGSCPVPEGALHVAVDVRAALVSCGAAGYR